MPSAASSCYVQQMALFSKKTPVLCPVCSEPFGKGVNVMSHNMQHALPAKDGGGGFMWRCSCGEEDGVWDSDAGAAAGLTMHMTSRHGVRWP